MIKSLIVLGIFLALILVILPNAIKIVPEYQRLVKFRLGRCIGIRGPGFVLILPVIDRVVRVDLRESFLEIPHQTAITEDNAPISIDFIIFNKVEDAQLSVLAVQNFAGAAQNIAATTLRSVVGDMSLDDVLSKREEMNQLLQAKLDEVTERWGVKVTNVEVREITPPPAVQEAMTRQMSAERTRRAVVTEADGSKQAAITVAEGHEAGRTSSRPRATGRPRSCARRASRWRSTRSSRRPQTVDANTMSLQYLDALKQIGASASTKFVIPMEFTNLLSSIVSQGNRAFGNGSSAGNGKASG